MSDTLTLSVGEAAYVGLTLLDRFGAKLPKPVVTCLACGNDEPDLACRCLAFCSSMNRTATISTPRRW